MITQTAEYALRAVNHLAEHAGHARTTHQIAEVTRVPEDYLSKVLKILVDAKMVSSQRGTKGGFRLQRDPHSLSLFEVIDVVSPLTRFRECPLGRDHGNGRLCPLHQMLDDALGDLESAFRSMTVSDLLEADRVHPGLCRQTPARVDVHVETNRAPTASTGDT